MSTPLRVLIVEDVEEEAFLIARSLRRNGEMPTWRRVETAATLRAALTDQTWDIVIGDYFMPSLNGIEALDIVHAMAPGMPFILISGTIGERIAVEAMRAGAQDYFVKGCIERLPMAVERELQDVATRRQRAAADAALNALQKQVFTFMRSAPIPIWIKDAGLRYVYANPAHCQLVNHTLEQMVGSTDALWAAEETAATIEEHDRLALRARSMVRSRHGLPRPRNGLKTMDVMRFPIPAENGQTMVAGVAIDITEMLNSETRLQEANVRLKRLSSQVIDVQERERKHLAQDLHDDIGHSLTALKMSLDGLVKYGDLTPESLDSVDGARTLLASVIERVRTLSLALRPPQLDDLGLVVTLRGHLERQATLARIELVFEGVDLSNRLDANIENTCFRIAQEVMANILRHADAKRVCCTLVENGPGLRLTMRDDGQGFDVEEALRRAVQGQSSGLLNMRERAALVGGSVTIVSRPGEGTCMELVLPGVPTLHSA